MKLLRFVIAATTVIILAFSSTSIAGGKEGGITQEMISKMQDSAQYNGPWRAIYNSLLNNEIKDLALDHDKAIQHKDLFNVTIKTKGITNQKSSGRCWLFASLNLLRPAMIEKYKLSKFEFSQNYLAFWDKLEKANMFLEEMIAMRDRDLLDRELAGYLKSPFGDGGWWFYTVDLIEKYGCVPKEAMPETKSSSKTGMMNNAISTELRKCAAELRDMAAKGASVDQLREAKEGMLINIYRMLTLNLGTPPTEFTWRYEDKDTVVSKPQEYTPQEFYKKVVGINLKDYVTLADHPSRPKFAMYDIDMSRNMYDKTDGAFLNVPIDTLKAYALKMLLEGEPVVFACDVGKDNFNDEGIFEPGIYDYESIYGIDLGMDKETKFAFHDLGANHMMLISACDTANAAVSKWKVENSWGSDRGDNGYWTMYDDWFNQNVFEIIVNKKYLSNDLQNLLKKEPVKLPSWDPYAEYFKY
jgi:bleomycin hydrolase